MEETARSLSRTVILPAYNEDQNIGDVIDEIKGLDGHFEILVIDDASTDTTGKIARSKGARVVRHAYRMGNGAAIKTGIRHAHGDILILMDSDSQMDAKYIPIFLEQMKGFTMIIGARNFKKGCFHRNLANIFYSIFASMLTGYKILDLTSGFRVVERRAILKIIKLLPNTFSYPSTSTICFLKLGYPIKFIPYEVKKRSGRSKINIFQDGMRFVLIILKTIMLYAPLKIFMPISCFFGLSGVIHAVWRLFMTTGKYTAFTVFLFIISMFVFLIGLVAEQISSLSFQMISNDTEG